MKIAVVGTGYVGLVAGTCLAEVGHDVTCVDQDEAKIEGLRAGRLPIYEPGLEELVPRNVEAGRLHFTTALDEAMDGAEVAYIAVGTPPGEDGSADLQYVEAVAEGIAATLDASADTPTTVVVKSTVPIGTCDRVKAIIAARTDAPFDVVSNPEFLREGVAVGDFLHPDRVVVGVERPEAAEVMRRVYAPILEGGAKFIVMNVRSSELTKYASNAMLATRISFMNELARLASRLGADIELVREGMGSDGRIGPAFLRAGVGYGGSCFPKDIQALLRTASNSGVHLEILSAVEDVNARQKRWLVDLIQEAWGEDLTGRRFALWGLAFKPDTDDMREAPAITIARALSEAGATVTGYDPEAAETAAVAMGDTVTIVGDPYEAAEGADALLLVTDWKQFATPDWARLKGLMAGDRVYDGRNLWEPAEVRAQGFEYAGIGRP